MNRFSRKAKCRSLLLASAVGLVLLAGCGSPESRAAKYVEHGKELIAQGQPDKARLEFRNALKIKPTLAEPYYELGVLDEADGNLRSAFENYTRAEQQDPHHQGALLKLANLYFGAERLDDAQTRIDTVLKLSPNDADAHAINAAIMLRHNDNTGAAKEVDAALKTNPANIPAISVKVGLYSAQNEVDKASAALEEGISHNPDDVSLLTLKVELFKKHNMLDKVAEAYQQVFAKRPASRGYRAQAAAYFSDAGKLDTAEKILRDGIATNPQDIEMKRLLVSFLNLKRGMPAAEQELQSLIKAEPSNDAYLFWLTDLYVQNKSVDKAVALLNQIISKNGSDNSSMAARTALARITFARGDQEGANKLLSVVLEKQPNNESALFVRSAIDYDKGLYQVAITDLRSLLREHPKSTEGLQLLSEALVKVGHVDLASETLAQLLDIQPENRAAQARLAQFYHLGGDEKRADLLLKAVTTDAPDYAIGWETQARIALDRRDLTLADQSIAKLEKMPDQAMTADYLRGVWSLAQNKPDDALAKFTGVINKDPRAPQSALALTALVNVYRQQGHLDTAVHFIEGLKVDTVDVHTLLANCYVELKQLEQAAKEYDKAIAVANGQADPFIGRARLYLAASKIDDAINVLKKASVIAPLDNRAPLMLADIAMQQTRYQDAMSIYSDLLSRNPELDVAANNYAELVADYAYQDKANLERARTLSDRFQASNNPALLDTLAWVYYRLGQYQQAASLMERVMAGKIITPQMHYHYGALLKQQGDKQKAAVELQKATVDGANYPGIEDAKTLLSQQ